jgi:hypothetical protein
MPYDFAENHAVHIMDATLLWHIPLSHYSEKVRWAPDYKGIAHRRVTRSL